MGKRKPAFSGLSQIAREVFGEQQPVSNTGTTTSHSPVEASPTPPLSEFASTRRNKRRKIRSGKEVETTANGNSRYDTTGSTEYHYRFASEVPDHLQKYFSQRRRYFSLYDQGCLLDEEGWYSVTPELIANQIAERCRCDTILDAFCGVGGNAIAFAKTCERVIALDNCATRLALARQNAAIYGVADRIEFILTDYLAFARSYLSIDSHSRARTIDVVFLSPPWGGPSYLRGLGSVLPSLVSASEDHMSEGVSEGAYSEYTLASIQPIHGAELFRLSRQITGNVAFYLPRNANLEEIASLVREEGEAEPSVENGKMPEQETDKSTMEQVEVEEEWMGTKLKALTCYFGGLVAGQENRF